MLKAIVVKKFIKKGTVENWKQNCGRKSLPDDKISDIKKHSESNPKPSLKRAGVELDISVFSVHKILKKTLRFEAYKPTFVQTLNQNFCRGVEQLVAIF